MITPDTSINCSVWCFICVVSITDFIEFNRLHKELPPAMMPLSSTTPPPSINTPTPLPQPKTALLAKPRYSAGDPWQGYGGGAMASPVSYQQPPQPHRNVLRGFSDWIGELDIVDGTLVLAAGATTVVTVVIIITSLLKDLFGPIFKPFRRPARQLGRKLSHAIDPPWYKRLGNWIRRK